jgi:hypothetical protein
MEAAAAILRDPEFRIHLIAKPLPPETKQPLLHHGLKLRTFGSVLEFQVVLFIEFDPPAVITAVILTGPHNTVKILVIQRHQRRLNHHFLFAHGITPRFLYPAFAKTAAKAAFVRAGEQGPGNKPGPINILR